jgi:arylsulfatase A-like enzyme
LLVTLDTTRSDHVSAYGYGRQTTPFLDGLARRSVRFAHAYTVMPTTDPAHASMLTCQYPRTHGILQNGARRTNPEGPSLAVWLAERGYETAAITARIGLDPKLRRIAGFEHSDAPRLPQKERGADEIVERSQRWLAERRGEAWFLWVHLWEPHKPYTPGRPARGMFSARAIPKQRRYEDPVRFLKKDRRVDPGVIEAAIALYDAEIWLADRALRRIVAAAIDAEPAGVEPVLFVLGDHGESLAERQDETRIGFGHGTHIQDEVVKIPWIVSWPGRLDARVIETPVSVVDMTPTLIDLVQPGAALPCEGRSLAHAVREGRKLEAVPLVLDRRPFVSKPIPGLRHAELAWIEFPWKLMAPEGGRPARLYRLDSDPGETLDVADREPEVVAALARRLAAWKAERPLRHARIDDSPEQNAERDALRSLGYID